MLNKLKREIRARKFFTTAEEATFYGLAAKEVEKGDIDGGLRAMALSKCDGDEVKAQAKYLQLRADVLKQEVALRQKLAETADREKKKTESSAFGATFWVVLVIGAVLLVPALYAWEINGNRWLYEMGFR